MFEPVRGGTRGGAGEFKWADVGADKDREHYLGHSINAPTGRWQKNKDIHWYNRDQKDSEDERREEIRKVKEAEADALAVALGFAPAPKADGEDDTPASGTNSTPIENPRQAMEKAEKKQKKEEKKARKEMKRLSKARGRDDVSDRRRRSRSRSPPRPGRRPSRERVRDYGERSGADYSEAERERERARQRRQWESNAARSQDHR